jgi:hypothetical protein
MQKLIAFLVGLVTAGVGQLASLRVRMAIAQEVAEEMGRAKQLAATLQAQGHGELAAQVRSATEKAIRGEPGPFLLELSGDGEAAGPVAALPAQPATQEGPPAAVKRGPGRPRKHPQPEDNHQTPAT